MATRNWPWALLLFGAVVVAYLPVWWAGYVWDDDNILTQNPCIVGPLGLKEIWTTRAADICPLTLTTFWFEYKLWGLNPLPYHLVNVVLHAVGAIVLWQVLRQLRIPGAWLGAALWALHPLQVESVAWISEMKNTQSGLFFLLSIFFFLREPVGRGNTLLTLLFGTLALASKSSTVILPVVLCLCAWWREGRLSWRAAWKILPIFLMAVFAGALTMWEQQTPDATMPGVPVQSWADRLITAGSAVWFYLSKLVWPWPLITVYPQWNIDSGSLISWLPPAAVLAATVYLGMKRTSFLRPVFFAWIYFLIALLPALNLVTNSFSRYSFVADHFQYLASMGPLALAGAGLASLRLPDWRVAASAVALTILGALSLFQAWNYETQQKLWVHTLAWNSACWEGENNLGNLLFDQGNARDSLPHFQRALALNSNFAKGHYNYGLALVSTGQTEAATAEYQKAIEIYPAYAKAHNNLGSVLLQSGHVSEALQHFQKAAESDPNFALDRYNSGIALVKSGNNDEAIAQFQEALKIAPGYLDAQDALGEVLFRRGRYDEAVPYLSKALENNPKNAETHDSFGAILAQKGHTDEAISHFQIALELKPDDEIAAYNLGGAFLQAGRVDQAIASFRKAIQLDPNDPKCHNNLGVALMQKGQPSEALAQFKEAVRLAPDYADAQKNLAAALINASQNRNAGKTRR